MHNMIFRVKEKRFGRILDIKNDMSSLIKEMKMEDIFVEKIIKEKWSDIVGNILSLHSVPARIDSNVLTIYSDHSVFVNDLVMLKDEIVNKVNSEVHAKKIKDIKVFVKKLI